MSLVRAVRLTRAAGLICVSLVMLLAEQDVGRFERCAQCTVAS